MPRQTGNQRFDLERKMFIVFDFSEDQNDDDEEEVLTDCRERSNSLDNVSFRSTPKKVSIDLTRDVLTRRHALDSTESHHLRSYVRHRKNSIVQHVIGYNYDDNSTAGGLYTRVGIGSKPREGFRMREKCNLVFCLGTVIHSGLSILSNLENRSCTRWTALIDDLSRLLFSFLQFFFIFKHSNVSRKNRSFPFPRLFRSVDHSSSRESRSLSCHSYRRDQSLCLVSVDAR